MGQEGLHLRDGKVVVTSPKGSGTRGSTGKDQDRSDQPAEEDEGEETIQDKAMHPTSKRKASAGSPDRVPPLSKRQRLEKPQLPLNTRSTRQNRAQTSPDYSRDATESLGAEEVRSVRRIPKSKGSAKPVTMPHSKQNATQSTKQRPTRGASAGKQSTEFLANEEPLEGEPNGESMAQRNINNTSSPTMFLPDPAPQHGNELDEEPDETLQEELEDSVGGSEGVTAILENPSPVKVDHQQAPSRAESHATKTLRQATATRPISEGESVAPKNERRRYEALILGPLPYDAAYMDDNTNQKVFYKMQALHKMRRTADLVGYKWSTRNAQHSQVKERKQIRNLLAKKLFVVIQHLTRTYHEMISNEEGGLVESPPATQDAFVKANGLISELTRKGLSKRQSDTGTLVLLRDLFFSVLPALYGCLVVAAKAFTLGKDVYDSNLNDFRLLCSIIIELSEGAVQQNIRPLSSNTKHPKYDYLFSVPTEKNLPRLIDFRKQIDKELRARELKEDQQVRIQEFLKLKRAKAEVEQRNHRRRLQEEAQEKVRRQQEIEITLERQREALAKILDAPVVGEFARKELQQYLQRQRDASGTGSQRAASSRPTQGGHSNTNANVQSSGSENDEGSGSNTEEAPEHAGESDIERVSVFGNDNRPRFAAPPPWTKAERARFVSIMASEARKYPQVLVACDKQILASSILIMRIQ